jgi:hypothetical protein
VCIPTSFEGRLGPNLGCAMVGVLLWIIGLAVLSTFGEYPTIRNPCYYRTVCNE